MYTHKKEQYTVYTTKCLVLSITDNLLSLCPANTWIPCSRCLVPAAVPSLAEAVQKLPRPTAQLRRSKPQARRLPPLCSGGDHEASVSQDSSPMSLQEWGCALRSPDQRCAALRAQGHTAQGKLCLITSHPNNIKLHCITFSCLVLLGLTVVYVRICLTDSWLWWPSLLLKARRHHANDPARLSRRGRGITLKSLLV